MTDEPDEGFSPEEAAEELRLRLKVYRGVKEAKSQLAELLADRDAYFKGNAVHRSRPSDPQARLF